MSGTNWRSRAVARWQATVERERWFSAFLKGDKWLPLPPLSRGRKIVRNLAVTVAVLVLIWGHFGYPLPTAGMEFRRLERQNLLPRGEIIFVSPKENDGGLPADGELVLNGRWVIAASGDDLVVASVGKRAYTRFIHTYPRTQGPVLLPLTQGREEMDDAYGFWVEHRYSHPDGGDSYLFHNFSPLLVMDAPEGTARIEAAVQEGDKTRRGGGWDMGGDVWLLGIEGQQFRGGWYLGLPYTLRFYGPDDALLLEREGTVPTLD